MSEFNPVELVTELEHDVPYEIKLTDTDIIRILRNQGVLLPDSKIEVEVIVPGGGDWSNLALEISENIPVTIRWKVKKTFVAKEELDHEPN